MSVTPDRFQEFFQALYGYAPFPWQARLIGQVAAAGDNAPGWPDALALPTAAGKTACIDIAVFAMACQAGLSPDQRTAPRKVFFVVDRRVIVDEAFDRAEQIAERLSKAQDGILREVADALRDIGGEDEPLACYQLRGGTYRDDSWVRSPVQPTAVTSTVDQFGSRLLFRGYGPSQYMWPVHAGMAANDTLVLLDEAHCSIPFSQTMQWIERYRTWKDSDTPAGPFRFVLVSATPPSDIKRVERASEEDRAHPVLGRRIGAPKPTRLMTASKARGEKALDELAAELSKQARGLLSDQRQAIAVIVNRVATARKVHAILEEDARAVLLTGRMRPLDKDGVVKQLDPLKSNSDAREAALEQPMFVVATQTLEVGADLDLDGMVSECASLDALRQRFGRLNRLGRDVPAKGVIVVRADQTDAKRGGDPVYGDRLANTWAWLNRVATDSVVDMGYEEMEALLRQDQADLKELVAPAPNAPVMLPAYVDAWAQTFPVPEPDPEVSLFLHGPGRGAPEVQVCWRSDLDTQHQLAPGEIDPWTDVLALCPPTSSECMPVPWHAVRRWLRGRDATRDIADVEGEATSEDESDDFRSERVALCWRGPEESFRIREAANLNRVRPGDTVVIPRDAGGWDVFGHVPGNGTEGFNPDVGDRAHLESKAIAVLRIHEATMDAWPKSLRDRALDMASKEEGPDRDELDDLLAELAASDEAQERPWLHDAARELQGYRRRRVHTGIYGDTGGMVLRGTRRLRRGRGAATSEDDSSSATVEVGLEEHMEGVAWWTRCFAQGAGLPSALVDDLALAGRLHDLGKADPRFQALLHAGNPFAAYTFDLNLLAKSGGLPLNASHQRRAQQMAGYPQGGRHELLSVRLAESVPAWLDTAHDSDLVLHLIASHHGRCRPFAPVVPDEAPVSVDVEVFGQRVQASSATGLERLDSGVPERFWHLVRRYGWWGLAWLESLMRLADHRRSQEEQEARGQESDEATVEVRS